MSRADRLRVLTVVGCRPQFVKAAAVNAALRARGVDEMIVHTGQHYDPELSDVFFDELGIPAPSLHLEVAGGAHGDMTGRMLQALEPVLAEQRPDWVLVFGDTNSTLAGALCAAKLRIPVAHVEAGLRSGNRAMPEEINRVVSDHVSDLLLCPTQVAVANLAREGITRGVHHTGDVMFDTTLRMRQHARERSTIVERLGVRDGGFAVATVHRAENTDDPAQLRRVVEWLRERAAELPVVFPVHPRTRLAAGRAGIDFDGLLTCPPVGFLDMARLLDGCTAVYTDSGGLQKEAYFHRKPCVTLRDETEWTETVEHGWNRLWSQPEYRPRRDIPDYGDGNAAVRIACILTSGSQGA